MTKPESPITDSDLEAAELEVMKVVGCTSDEVGEYGTDINIYLAGILHERASAEEVLVKALIKIAAGTCNVCEGDLIARDALKNWRGEK